MRFRYLQNVCAKNNGVIGEQVPPETSNKQEGFSRAILTLLALTPVLASQFFSEHGDKSLSSKLYLTADPKINLKELEWVGIASDGRERKTERSKFEEK